MRVISVAGEEFVTPTEERQYYTPLTANNLTEKLRSHWTNGVKMFADYGASRLSSQHCTVCACRMQTDVQLLFEEYETCPSNTILFLQAGIAERNRWQNPFPDFNFFVCEYSTFMKFTSYWKKLNDYAYNSNIMAYDDINAQFNGVLFEHSLQYRILQ